MNDSFIQEQLFNCLQRIIEVDPISVIETKQLLGKERRSDSVKLLNNAQEALCAPVPDNKDPTSLEQTQPGNGKEEQTDIYRKEQRNKFFKAKELLAEDKSISEVPLPLESPSPKT